MVAQHPHSTPQDFRASTLATARQLLLQALLVAGVVFLAFAAGVGFVAFAALAFAAGCFIAGFAAAFLAGCASPSSFATCAFVATLR